MIYTREVIKEQSGQVGESLGSSKEEQYVLRRHKIGVRTRLVGSLARTQSSSSVDQLSRKIGGKM